MSKNLLEPKNRSKTTRKFINHNQRSTKFVSSYIPMLPVSEDISTDPFPQILFRKFPDLSLVTSLISNNLGRGESLENYTLEFTKITFFWYLTHFIAQKIKFFVKDFFSKCDQIRSFLQIWSHLAKKSLIENFIFRQCFFSVFQINTF